MCKGQGKGSPSEESEGSVNGSLSIEGPDARHVPDSFALVDRSGLVPSSRQHLPPMGTSPFQGAAYSPPTLQMPTTRALEDVASAAPVGKTVAELEMIAMGSQKAGNKRGVDDAESGRNAKHKKADAKAAAVKKKADEAAKKVTTELLKNGIGDSCTRRVKLHKKDDNQSEHLPKKVKTEAEKLKKDTKPPMPKIKMGTCVHYRTGRVLVSVPDQCFRVFEKAGDRVDKKKKFASFDSKEKCWAACLAIIDAAHT